MSICNEKIKSTEEEEIESIRKQRQSVQTTEENPEKLNSMDGKFIAVKMLTILGKYSDIRKKILNKSLTKCLSILLKVNVADIFFFLNFPLFLI